MNYGNEFILHYQLLALFVGTAGLDCLEELIILTSCLESDLSACHLAGI